MRTLTVKFCLLLISLTMTVLAQAYESDTHLRLTYHLARAVGINDEVAKFIAIGNQYIDSNVKFCHALSVAKTVISFSRRS